MIRKDIEFIKETLQEAILWADYADDYFKEKHFLESDKERVDKSIKLLETFESKIQELELIIKGKDVIIESMLQGKNCENCKYYDGSHKCNNKNSIAFNSESRVYPYDGCKEDFELKENQDVK